MALHNYAADYLPVGLSTLTDDAIERHVERATNAIDRLFMAGRIPQADYDYSVKRMDSWATAAYARSDALRRATS